MKSSIVTSFVDKFDLVAHGHDDSLKITVMLLAGGANMIQLFGAGVIWR